MVVRHWEGLVGVVLEYICSCTHAQLYPLFYIVLLLLCYYRVDQILRIPQYRPHTLQIGNKDKLW